MTYFGISRAREIVNATCKVLGVNKKTVVNNTRQRNINFARGIYCLVCYNEGIHPLFSSIVINCSRSNIINITRHYRNYYEIKDKEVVYYYNLVNKYLKDEKI